MVLNVPVHECAAAPLDEIELNCSKDLFDKSGFFKVDPTVRQLLQLSAREMRTYPEDEGLARSLGICLLQLLSKRVAPAARTKRRRLNMEMLDAYILGSS
jgi:hypothetical protein